MREQRMNDLKDYKKTLEAIGDFSLQEKDRLIAEKASILKLELPFKTDTVSLMESYEKIYSPKADWNSKKHATNFRSTEEEVWQRNSFFKSLYKHQILPIFYQEGTETFEIPIEDFHLETVYQVIKKRILDSELKESMKKKWCSKLNSLRSHQQNGYASAVSQIREIKPPKEIDLFAPPGFFEYLEDQFLKTGSNEDFRNLAAIRLAFYLDIPTRGLSQIKFKDIKYFKENWYWVTTEKYSRGKNNFLKKTIPFRLPFSYFELLQTGFKNSSDTIVPFSEKEFYKLIKSLFTKYRSETSTKTSRILSPKMLKIGLKQVCLIKKFPDKILPDR